MVTLSRLGMLHTTTGSGQTSSLVPSGKKARSIGLIIWATATFGFKGTAVYVMGSAEEGAVSITVGGENVSSTRGGEYLAPKSGMKVQWWDVIVKGPTGV